MKKIILILSILLISGCNQVKENEFKNLYNAKTEFVTEINYKDFLTVDTGVVFIGGINKKSQDLATLLCDLLCEHGIDKAYFIKESNVPKEDLIKHLEIEKISFPAVLFIKDKKLINYYDEVTEAEDQYDYIYNLFNEIYPAFCEKLC